MSAHAPGGGGVGGGGKRGLSSGGPKLPPPLRNGREQGRGWLGAGRSPSASSCSAERREARPQLLDKNHRLLPGREMAAFFGLVVIDELRIGLLGPAQRRLILL